MDLQVHRSLIHFALLLMAALWAGWSIFSASFSSYSLWAVWIQLALLLLVSLVLYFEFQAWRSMPTVIMLRKHRLFLGDHPSVSKGSKTANSDSTIANLDSSANRQEPLNQTHSTNVSVNDSVYEIDIANARIHFLWIHLPCKKQSQNYNQRSSKIRNLFRLPRNYYYFRDSFTASQWSKLRRELNYLRTMQQDKQKPT